MPRARSAAVRAVRNRSAVGRRRLTAVRSSSMALTAEPDSVKELDRQLTLNESILRTKVIRPDTK